MSLVRLMFPSAGAIAGALSVALVSGGLAAWSGKTIGHWLGVREGRAVAELACEAKANQAAIEETERQRRAAAKVQDEAKVREAERLADLAERKDRDNAILLEVAGDPDRCDASERTRDRLRRAWRMEGGG